MATDPKKKNDASAALRKIRVIKKTYPGLRGQERETARELAKKLAKKAGIAPKPTKASTALVKAKKPSPPAQKSPQVLKPQGMVRPPAVKHDPDRPVYAKADSHKDAYATVDAHAVAINKEKLTSSPRVHVLVHHANEILTKHSHHTVSKIKEHYGSVFKDIESRKFEARNNTHNLNGLEAERLHHVDRHNAMIDRVARHVTNAILNHPYIKDYDQAHSLLADAGFKPDHKDFDVIRKKFGVGTQDSSPTSKVEAPVKKKGLFQRLRKIVFKESLETGTDNAVDAYRDVTPGQEEAEIGSKKRTRADIIKEAIAAINERMTSRSLTTRSRRVASARSGLGKPSRSKSRRTPIVPKKDPFGAKARNKAKQSAMNSAKRTETMHRHARGF